MIDAEARRRIAADLDTTFVVEAAAGTGKTSALVGRIVSALARGAATLPGILAVTFTEKAAGEMKLRLRNELERAREGAASDDERGRLVAALADLEAARVGTIHSLCTDFLREHPVAAGIDPRFEVLAEDEAPRLVEAAFDAWFEAELAAPREGVRRILRRRPRGRNALAPRRLLLGAARKRIEHRDHATPWRRDPFDRGAALEEARARLAALATRHTTHPGADRLGWNLRSVAETLGEVARREALLGPDLDGLEAELHHLMRDRTWKEPGTRRFWGEAHAEVLAQRDAAAAAVRDALALADADLAACLFEELGGVVTRYEALKAAAGKLDFLDLLLRCRDLVRDDAAARARIAASVTHIFVDEFQDTDPVQADLLLRLCDERPRPGMLFVVGDPKQSIYRFRRADLALYEAVKARLVAGGAEVLRLSTSFRAAPEIQSAVNAAFAPRMTGGPGQAAYVPLAPYRAPGERPAVIALPAPHPYAESGRITGERLEASTADAVGALVAHLVTTGIAPRHVCLLFRRLTSLGEDTTRPYVRALEARGVPHVLVGGRSLHEREEVIALRAALTAIEWPDDPLAVYAALRGPFFAAGDEELLVHRAAHGLHPLDLRGADPAASRIAAALAALGELHRARNRRPIADTVARLLERSRAHLALALWPGGEQVLANVLRVLDLARRFEAAGTTSFRAFVERLADDAEQGEGGDAPVVEEGTEGVRIMTVHKAKGLEFPVVVLCEPSAPRSFARGGRLTDEARGLWLEDLAGCVPAELREREAEVRKRDEEEGVRLVYVAATRARDLLVVPVVGDGPQPGWLDVLDPALQPRARRAPVADAGGDTVLDRPPDAQPSAPPVRAGLHLPLAGEHPVCWWDPATLALGVTSGGGLRQEELLADGGAAGEGRAAYAAWRDAREAVTLAAATPTLPARPATAVVLPRRAPVRVERVARPDAARPGGRRFGKLVHAVLAAVPLDADAGAIAAVAGAEARLLGATRDERHAAIAAAGAALGHPLLRRAAAARALHRETPVVLQLDDGSLAEGVVDVAFRDAAGWVVIDFKTDAELGEQLPRYEAQVAVYVAAVARATGEPAEGVLLVV